MSRPELDAAIDRLDEALRAAGLAGLEAPKDLQALDEVAEAVAPFALPLDLRRFWERVDPERLPVTLFPRLHGPATALELYRVDLEFSVPLRPPVLFFVIGYDSHVHRSIELTSKWDGGGTILRWAWDEEAFRIAYRSIADLLDVVSELVSAGRFERYGDELHVSEEAEEKRSSSNASRSRPPHPLYGEAREISGDLSSWPAHWLAASGIDLRDREPLGATHTIAEFVAGSRGRTG